MSGHKIFNNIPGKGKIFNMLSVYVSVHAPLMYVGCGEKRMELMFQLIFFIKTSVNYAVSFTGRTD
jgi:hypothetical protein